MWGRSATTRGLLSNTHRAPNASLRTHAASLTLTTNHPGLAGASPEPTSSSCASSIIIALLSSDLRLLAANGRLLHAFRATPDRYPAWRWARNRTEQPTSSGRTGA